MPDDQECEALEEILRKATAPEYAHQSLNLMAGRMEEIGKIARASLAARKEPQAAKTYEYALPNHPALAEPTETEIEACVDAYDETVNSDDHWRAENVIRAVLSAANSYRAALTVREEPPPSVERWMVDYENGEGEPQHAVLSWLDDEAKDLPEVGTSLIRELDAAPSYDAKQAVLRRQGLQRILLAVQRERDELRLRAVKAEQLAAAREDAGRPDHETLVERLLYRMCWPSCGTNREAEVASGCSLSAGEKRSIADQAARIVEEAILAEHGEMHYTKLLAETEEDTERPAREALRAILDLMPDEPSSLLRRVRDIALGALSEDTGQPDQMPQTAREMMNRIQPGGKP